MTCCSPASINHDVDYLHQEKKTQGRFGHVSEWRSRNTNTFLQYGQVRWAERSWASRASLDLVLNVHFGQCNSPLRSCTLETCFGIAQAFVKRLWQCGHVLDWREDELRLCEEAGASWDVVGGVICCMETLAEEAEPTWFIWAVNLLWDGKSSIKCFVTVVASGRDPRDDRLLSPSLCCGWNAMRVLSFLELPCFIVSKMSNVVRKKNYSLELNKGLGRMKNNIDWCWHLLSLNSVKNALVTNIDDIVFSIFTVQEKIVQNYSRKLK